jgi:hypothetical protein
MHFVIGSQPVAKDDYLFEVRRALKHKKINAKS